MPIARFEMPDGRIARFEVPEGTTPEQAQAMIAEQMPAMQEPKSQPTGIRGEGFDKAMAYGKKPGEIKQNLGDLVAGAVRGAGSIGATLLAPRDALESLIARKMGAPELQVPSRRPAMDEALTTMGADPGSMAFKGGKLGTEVMGTLGVGGALAKGLAAIPYVAKNAPLLINAIRSGGMNLGGTTGGRVADMGLRMTGGAITGGGAAGLINPEDAGAGALVGAVAPPVIQAAGAAGKNLGERMASKYDDALAAFGRGAPKRETIKTAVEAGYVIPPNLVNPSTKNALIESFSGKQATGQIASVRNQQVTEKLVRESLGLADDVPLTKTALEQIRKIEGGAYQKVANLSDDAAQTLEALKQARNDAQGWFNAYNRSASPADLAKAKEFRAMADSLENALEFHATAAGKESLIPALKEARKQIAKTYTVERALNDASGTVNARVLGRLYEKGKPLSGGLETVGKFASSFPSVSQAPQQMGSPAAHNLRASLALLMSGGGVAAAGPLGLAAGVAPFVAGPASRSIMFRKGAQEALANQAAPSMGIPAHLAELLQNRELQELLVRSAPAIAAQGR